jgi:predicted transposase YbfD/YdcC
VHLFAALAHGSGTVLAQRQVAAETNEVTQFQPLLADVDLAGRAVTADALHTQSDHAEYLVTTRRADYVLTVKGNQPSLVRSIDHLPPDAFSPANRTVDRGHGRIERRAIQTAPVPATARFPHAQQVLVLTRHVTDLAGGHPRAEVVYGITSLDAGRADPARPAALVRGQWETENRTHRVRDVTFGEDASQVRARRGPQVMATLRNLAISLLRLGGHGNILEGCRGTRAVGWPLIIPDRGAREVSRAAGR